MLEHLALRPQDVVIPLEASLSAFLLDREASRCTPKTLVHYRYTVGSFVAWLKAHDVYQVTDVTPPHIRAYLVALQQRGLRDTTQHAHARGIKAWLNWLVNEGDRADSPMRKVAMPRLDKRVPPPFASDELGTLLDACERHTPIGSRNRAIVLTLLDTGLRVAELTELRVGDVDMRTGLCMVMGKGRKARQVRVGNKARAVITRMLAFRPDARDGDPLWIAYDGAGCPRSALTVHGIQLMLQRLGRKTGVTPCSPHRFRRTFALWCLRDGMDLHSLRLLMGHSSLTVPQRYLALAGEDIERAHIAHSPVDRLLDSRTGGKK